MQLSLFKQLYYCIQGEFVGKKTVKTSESISNFGGQGWGIIIYCALMFWFHIGMVNDGSNITAPAFAAKTGIPYGTVLSMGTVAGLVGFIFFVVIGQINRKTGPRKTSAALMIIAGLSYIGVGYANSLVTYAICLCFVVGTTMSAGYISGGVLVANWFPKKRGIVMGYTTMGHNLASALYVPFIAFLVVSFGLTNGVLLPGILCMLVGIIGLIFIRDTPLQRGVYPDNVDAEEYEAEYFTKDIDENGGWTTKKLLSTKQLWICAVTTGLFQLVSACVMTQLVVRNMELGFTQAQAVSMMTVLACIGIFGSWLFGVLDQKFGTKKTMLVFAVWYIIALASNITETKVGIYLSVFMIGMAIGGSANFTVSLPANVFGRHGFAKVNSVVFPIQGLITAFQFLVSAVSIGITGSLRGAYVFLIGVLVINIIIILFAKERQYNRDFQIEEEHMKHMTA